MQYDLKFDLYPQQDYFIHNDDYRFIWLSSGVACGKSEICGALYKLRRAIKYPESIGVIGANTYKQLSQATLRAFFKTWEKCGLVKDRDYVIHKAPPANWPRFNTFDRYDGILTFRNGRQELLWSFDRPELIEGIQIGDFLIDETRKTKADAWKYLVARLRCDKTDKQQGRVITVPEGRNWLYEEFQKDPNLYKIVFMSTRENKYLREHSPEFLEHLLKTYDPELAKQEIDGRIVVLSKGKVYYMYRAERNARRVYPYDPTRPIIMGWDFNIFSQSPISVVLSQEWFDQKTNTWHVQAFDEIVIEDGDTPGACSVFLNRYANVHRSQVWAFGDASGELNASVTEFKLINDHLSPLYGANLKLFPKRSNPREALRVASVNAMLGNALGEVRAFIDPEKCLELIKDLSQLVPKEAGGIDKKDKKRSHTSDGWGYYIVRRFPAIHSDKTEDQILANIA